MSPRKSTKTGLIFSQPKSVNSTKSYPSKYVTSLFNNDGVDETAPLKNNLATAPIAYDITTGIKSSSPEVVLFTNFIPAYDANGNLNSLGQLMQAKQDAMLVSAMQSIKSILQSSSTTQNLDTQARINKKQLLKFCEEFGIDINDLLTNISDINSTINVKNYKPSEGVYTKYGLDQTSKEKPIPLVDVLSAENEDHVKNWTTTKLWLQSVRKFKELLRHGPVDLFFTDGASLENADNIQNYKNPYKLTRTRSQNIKRFDFKTRQSTYRDMTTMYQSISSGDANAIEDYAAELKKLFSRDIFTKNISAIDDTFTTLPEKLAKIAHAICKEYRYSTKMDPTVLADYGYAPTQSQTNMFDVWNYLIGEFPEDITVIPTTPRGGGKALASLAQQRIDNNEILFFEDRYIDDSEAGTNREGAIITPGSYYYLESSLNSGPQGFDISRLSRLNNQSIRSMLNMVEMLSKVVFPVDILPSTQFTETRKYEPDPVKIDKPFDSPVLLLRAIVQRILGPSGFFTLLNESKSESQNFVQTSPDISALLICAAADDPELKALLFMHQLSTMLTVEDTQSTFDSTQQSAQTNATNSDSILRPLLSQKIMLRLSNLLASKNKNANIKPSLASFNVPLSAFTSAFSNGYEPGFPNFECLNNIALFIKDITKFSDNKNWFNTKSVPVQGSTNTFNNPSNAPNATSAVSLQLTPYTGVQKIIFYAAVFELCIMAVKFCYPYKILAEVNAPAAPPPPGGFTESTTSYVIDGLNLGLNQYLAKSEAAEKLLYQSSLQVHKCINSFKFYLSDLSTLLKNFESNLASGKYASTFLGLRSILGNQQLVSSALTQDQLLLIRSKIDQVVERCKDDYESPLAEVAPYFTSLSKNTSFNNYIPFEDTHLISWNAFLKSFLKEKNLRENKGHNSKIISVGLPIGMYRRLQTKTNSVALNTFRNGIIQISIYRVDTLRPDLVHYPLTYLFDMKRFPTRLLRDYVKSNTPPPVEVDAAEASSWAVQSTTSPQAPKPAIELLTGNEVLNKNLFPMLESVSSYSTEIKKILNFQEAFGGSNSSQRYPFLNDVEKIEIYRNHVNSFLMEEYIKFLSDVSVDENRYIRYEKISELSLNTLASQIVNSTALEKGLPSTRADALANDTTTSLQGFFANDTLFGDFPTIRRNLVSPRKFDRVFHIIFDPDDFSIDTNLTSSDALKAHQDVLKQLSQVGQNTTTTVLRKETLPGEITFDKYYVTVSTYDESNK
jgi:hypothetical protein